MNNETPDRNKTELTQNVTRHAVLWFDAKGFKPVETEVSIGVSRGWIADVGGAIMPTQTTGMVALERGRRAILIELNSEYCGLIKKRCDVVPGFEF